MNRRARLTLTCALWACGSPPETLATGPLPPADAALDAMAPDAGLPDLTVDMGRLLADLAIEERWFADDACELDPDEACIGGPGLRRLLRFSVETPNLGQADLVVGRPSPDNPAFQYSACHDHYHYVGYAEYSLVDASESRVVQGRKQAFCLVDSHRYVDEPGVPGFRRFSCANQGVQRGWADVYPSGLACQFLDITDLGEETYALRLAINHERTLAEASHGNNTAEIAVMLGDPRLRTPTEPCPDLGEHALATTNRECGFAFMQSFTCTPGALFELGCAQACDLGACTGDPMLRVCESDRTDGNCSFAAALGSGDNECSSSCPRVRGLECPASGRIDVYGAPKQPGQPFTCDLTFAYLPGSANAH